MDAATSAGAQTSTGSDSISQEGGTPVVSREQQQQNISRGSKAHRRGYMVDPREEEIKTQREAKDKNAKASVDPEEESERRSEPSEDEPKGAKKLDPQEKKKYKVKVDGQDLEVEEEELIKGYGLRKASHKMYEEGVKAKQNFDALVKALGDEDALLQILQKRGHDPIKLAEKVLGRHIDEQTMDPREKELRDARAENERLKKAREADIEAARQQRINIKKEALVASMTEEFTQALDKVSGLPKTKENVAKMAEYIARAAKEEGWKMSAEEAATLVLQDLDGYGESNLRNASGEKLLKILGDEAVTRLLQARGAQVKDPNAVLRTPELQPEVRRTRESSNLTAAEWNRLRRAR